MSKPEAWAITGALFLGALAVPARTYRGLFLCAAVLPILAILLI